MIKKKSQKKGFSIIELVVVISIFGIMTAISMFNYSDHKKSLEATDLAQDIALTVRQAQVYGISASGGKIGSKDFDADEFFGGENPVDITKDRSIRGITFFLNSNKIVLFADNNRNYVYNEGDRIIDERRITYNNTSFLSFGVCGDGMCTEKDKGRVDIAFERPYPDAMISYSGSEESGASTPKNYDSVDVIVGSDISEKTVTINSIGNITVN